MEKTKKIVTISLIVFIIVVVLILGLAVVSGQKAGSQPVINDQNQNIISAGITSSEVSKHNLINDCWLTVNSKVYNVTDFINLHPGGSDKIAPLCGKDATQAFETRGGNGPHPDKAKSVLNNYYIGNLKI